MLSRGDVVRDVLFNRRIILVSRVAHYDNVWSVVSEDEFLNGWATAYWLNEDAMEIDIDDHYDETAMARARLIL